MGNLISTICHSYDKGGFYSRTSQNIDPSCQIRYLEVPFEKGIVEIPTFMTYVLYKDDIFLKDIDVIALELIDEKRRTYYKSLDPKMREMLSASALEVTEVYDDGHGKSYFGKPGMLFDSNWNPILMMSWRMEKDENGKVIPLKPLLRVHPSCFILKEDPVQRYIINRIVPTALEQRISYNEYGFMNTMKVEIIIGEIPFKPRTVNKPSISTTNEDLQKTLRDNLDDLIEIT